LSGFSIFRVFLVIGVALSLSLPGRLVAQEEPAPELTVAAALCPPFVMEEEGELRGLSMFLWDNVARELGVKYTVELMSIGELFDQVSSGEAGVGVSCLSITNEREKIVDFSHSFFETHKAIGVKKASTFSHVKHVLLSERALKALGIFLGVAALVGLVFFLLEHRNNAKLFSMKTRAGRIVETLIVGMLFVTRSPIKYYEFKTFTARILSAIIGLASTVFVASLTAILASAFTLDQLHNQIRAPQDLAFVKVGTLSNSTSGEYLRAIGVPARGFDTPNEVVTKLNEGEVEAVVMDAPALKYEIFRGRELGVFDDLEVLPIEFEEQNYGLALRDESPYVEVLNRALLSVRKSPAWDAEVHRYFGE